MNTSSSSVANGEIAFVSLPDGASEGIDSNEKYVRTDHLLGDIKHRTISSGLITVAAQGVQFVLNLVSIMILARLLTPKDFGLYAMVTAVMGYVIVFKDAGLSTATVQREGLTHRQVSNLFWLNIALSGTVTLVSRPVLRWWHGFTESRDSLPLP